MIADISQGMTLEPGDSIATGTPKGVGAGRTPPEWLWPGDVIEAGGDGHWSVASPGRGGMILPGIVDRYRGPSRRMFSIIWTRVRAVVASASESMPAASRA